MSTLTAKLKDSTARLKVWFDQFGYNKFGFGSPGNRPAEAEAAERRSSSTGAYILPMSTSAREGGKVRSCDGTPETYQKAAAAVAALKAKLAPSPPPPSPSPPPPPPPLQHQRHGAVIEDNKWVANPQSQSQSLVWTQTNNLPTAIAPAPAESSGSSTSVGFVVGSEECASTPADSDSLEAEGVCSPPASAPASAPAESSASSPADSDSLEAESACLPRPSPCAPNTSTKALLGGKALLCAVLLCIALHAAVLIALVLVVMTASVRHVPGAGCECAHSHPPTSTSTPPTDWRWPDMAPPDPPVGGEGENAEGLEPGEIVDNLLRFAAEVPLSALLYLSWPLSMLQAHVLLERLQ